MMKNSLILLYAFILINLSTALMAQNHDIIVNRDGVMINEQTGEEVHLFGVNYSTPFAHSYRALKKMGIDHKKVIDQDVYHFARLNFDGFRIHIWDTEISDSLGNLIQNEHLDLFDYMLWKLEERNIKVIITPLTFYDNAYPDGATPTPGFANYISKEEAPLNKEFYPVIKNYLQQFLHHKNPYTGKTYLEDPNIIATEIINEPTHSGDLDAITNFIDEMTDHVRQTGWEKPVFYNVAQNPDVAEAVLQADVDGISFQWYPAGLVGGETMHKNYMPHIADYPIPFKNHPGFKHKAKMVYEFDAADTRNSYAYPLMARSFREAGFQWATQFAYDPIGIAPFNSDYPTHFLNLMYSPKRAISMLIAGEVFRKVPRNASFSNFEKDTSFYGATISHTNNLTVWNEDEAFLYTGTTHLTPESPGKLQRIAGTGSSPLVHYDGNGAYFLDKLENGIWRLEVYPDVINLSDPFAKPNFGKRNVRLQYNEYEISLELPGLSQSFYVKNLTAPEDKAFRINESTFNIKPGVYLLSNKLPDVIDGNFGERNIGINEYVQVQEPEENHIQLSHQPNEYWIAGQNVVLEATINLREELPVRVILAPYGRRGRDILMQKDEVGKFSAIIPGDFIQTGKMNYWISVGDYGEMVTFPGGYEGYPWQWDYYHDESWEVEVITETTPVTIFDAGTDYNKIDFPFYAWLGEYDRDLTVHPESGQFLLSVYSDSLKEANNTAMGFSVSFPQKFPDHVNPTKGVSISGESYFENDQRMTIILTDRKGHSYSSYFKINSNFTSNDIPFEKFTPDSMVLLPRPYPTFLPFWFSSETTTNLNPAQIEQVQILLLPDDKLNKTGSKAGFSVSKIQIH